MRVPPYDSTQAEQPQRGKACGAFPAGIPKQKAGPAG